ncbi:MAG: hypothetical protein ACI4FZ_10970 [Lachnospiraceae bacterium]
MKLSVKDIVLIALLSALLLISQVALAPIPNVELVSLLLILYTMFFQKKTLYIIYVFVLLEGILYGFGMWWFCYLYVWTILWGITMLLKSEQNALFWALVSGFFGLAFGTLCSVPYFLTGGIEMGLGWIVSGLPFDITHGIGNFVVALLLFRPLHYALSRICKR